LRGNRYIAPVLKDRPGFIVNRMNAPANIYIGWVFDQAKEKGIDWSRVDADAGGKMPMGPCELADYVGLDTMIHVSKYYQETLSPDFEAPKVVKEMVDAGNLGAKSGKGFYDWSGGRDAIKAKVKAAEPAGLFNLENTMAILLNEGCRILEEGIASGYKIIDDANMAGMNSPGPFAAGKKNYERWSKLLEDLADKTRKDYLRPCDLMKSGEFVNMRK
jgi:enoyl-CoA hydratase/3-hydroxyacyl-CoA dehydrogenase